jgi:hypothetical protein
MQEILQLAAHLMHALTRFLACGAPTSLCGHYGRVAAAMSLSNEPSSMLSGGKDGQPSQKKLQRP